MKLTDITRSLGDYINDAVLITEAEPVGPPGPRILWCNKAFTVMTEYTLADVEGKTPRILQGGKMDPGWASRMDTN